MMADPEEFAEKEKGKNLVRSEVLINAALDLNQATPWTLLQPVDFCSKDKVAFRQAIDFVCPNHQFYFAPG